jgi:myo-inositol-1(or 4)-monophosphatase
MIPSARQSAAGRHRIEPATVPEIDEHALKEVAEEAARAAAVELTPRFGGQAQGVQAKTTPTDLVSEADLVAERAIRQVLHGRRPDDAILGEEGGATGEPAGGSGLRWVVDPLDGTINFLFGIPAFAVSVACERSQPSGESASRALAGVVLDPLREECFAATRSSPATLNGVPIHDTGRQELSRALVATGFGYDAGVRARQAAVVARVLPRVRDIRRVGAAALDLAWAACGRLDAYYERGVQPWDVAAGALIAERAGLAVRTLAATGKDAAGIVAAPPAIVDELVELVAGP